MGASALRVVIVDDHEPVRALVRALLHRSDATAVVAEADGSPGQVAAACEQHPDVVLLDQDLGGRRGTELIDDILHVCPRAMIAIFSALDPHREEAAALGAGAFAFYEKSVATTALPQLVVDDHDLFLRALEGEDVCAPSAAARRAALA